MIPKEICKDYIIEYKNLIINLRCRLVMVSVYGDILPIYVDNTIYCLVYSLRKKLEANSKYIQTVRGVGYKFVIPEE